MTVKKNGTIHYLIPRHLRDSRYKFAKDISSAHIMSWNKENFQAPGLYNFSIAGNINKVLRELHRILERNGSPTIVTDLMILAIQSIKQTPPTKGSSTNFYQTSFKTPIYKQSKHYSISDRIEHLIDRRRNKDWNTTLINEDPQGFFSHPVVRTLLSKASQEHLPFLLNYIAVESLLSFQFESLQVALSMGANLLAPVPICHLNFDQHRYTVPLIEYVLLLPIRSPKFSQLSEDRLPLLQDNGITLIPSLTHGASSYDKAMLSLLNRIKAVSSPEEWKQLLAGSTNPLLTPYDGLPLKSSLPFNPLAFSLSKGSTLLCDFFVHEGYHALNSPLDSVSINNDLNIMPQWLSQHHESLLKQQLSSTATLLKKNRL